MLKPSKCDGYDEEKRQTPEKKGLYTLTLWFWIKLDWRAEKKHHPWMEAHPHVTSVLTGNSEERMHPSWVNFCRAALQPDRPGWFYCPVFGVPVNEVSKASHVSRSISISTSPIWLWPQPAHRALQPTRCFWFSSGGWTMRSSRWTCHAGWPAG